MIPGALLVSVLTCFCFCHQFQPEKVRITLSRRYECLCASTAPATPESIISVQNIDLSVRCDLPLAHLKSRGKPRVLSVHYTPDVATPFSGTARRWLECAFARLLKSATYKAGARTGGTLLPMLFGEDKLPAFDYVKLLPVPPPLSTALMPCFRFAC